MEKKPKKEVNLCVKIPAWLREKIWAYTEKTGTKIKGIIQKAIKEFFNRRPK
ncbi:hypothetical protein ES705_11030 [subsurface metagenome]